MFVRNAERIRSNPCRYSPSHTNDSSSYLRTSHSRADWGWMTFVTPSLGIVVVTGSLERTSRIFITDMNYSLISEQRGSSSHRGHSAVANLNHHVALERTRVDGRESLNQPSR